MKKLLLGLVMIGLVFGLAGVAMAADSDNHSVTVTVSAINEIDVTGGNLTLNHQCSYCRRAARCSVRQYYLWSCLDYQRD